MPKAKHFDYFKFHPTKWLSGIIHSMDDDAQGVFIQICCHYWIRKCSMEYTWLKAKQSKRKQMLSLFLEHDIIRVDEAKNTVNIAFLDEQWQQAMGLTTTRSSAGSKGGRGNKKQMKANALQMKAKNTAAPASPSILNTGNNTTNIKKKADKKLPPTLEEFTAYFVENGFPPQLAARAYKGYDANKDEAGYWRDSRHRYILNWRTKCQQVWFREENKVKAAPEKIIAQDTTYTKGI